MSLGICEIELNYPNKCQNKAIAYFEGIRSYNLCFEHLKQMDSFYNIFKNVEEICPVLSNSEVINQS